MHFQVKFYFKNEECIAITIWHHRTETSAVATGRTCGKRKRAAKLADLRASGTWHGAQVVWLLL
jgi:hypothetical protein